MSLTKTQTYFENEETQNKGGKVQNKFSFPLVLEQLKLKMKSNPWLVLNFPVTSAVMTPIYFKSPEVKKI